MNVKDIPAPKVPTHLSEIAERILNRQEMLEQYYWQIENRPTMVLNPNNRSHQVWIKDFLWRITEEVGETLEAANRLQDREHVYEEIADSLHFVAGLAIITDSRTGFLGAISSVGNQQQYGNHKETLEDATTQLMMCLGLAGNCLKMKPWKQTDVSTDLIEFKSKLYELYVAFLEWSDSLELAIPELFQMYIRKSEVNLFRIRSKY